MRKNYKLLRGLLEIGMFAAFAIIIWQGIELFDEWRLSWHREMVESLEDYYEFKPNGQFSIESRERFEAYTNEAMYAASAAIYTEYLAKWAEEENAEILRFEPYIVYEQDKIKVITYLNSIAYEMNWADFSMPLKEGRWFEGEQDEVICVAGFSYEVGDVIILEDKNGQAFEATVVGKMKYPYIFHNYMGMSGKLKSFTNGYSGFVNVFLLNPESVHNEKSDLINYYTTLIKLQNDIVPEDIVQHGDCVSVEEILIRQKPDYIIPLISMGVCLFMLIVFWIAEIIFKKQERIDNCKVVVLRKQKNSDIDFY